MTYKKGVMAERELIEMFWENGLAALRIAGSGASRYPCPDILAGDGIQTLAIEVKSIKGNTVYIKYDQIVKLVTFAQKFGAIPYVGVRFDRKDWIFLDIGKIRYTKGENFKVSKSFAYKDGKRFEELIRKFEQKHL